MSYATYEGRRIKCAREGCPRIIPRHRLDKWDTCTNTCKEVVGELARAQRVCAATGDGEHWSLAVALNDALTQYRLNETRMYHAARDVGISNDRWDAIKRGA